MIKFTNVQLAVVIALSVLVGSSAIAMIIACFRDDCLSCLKPRRTTAEMRESDV